MEDISGIVQRQRAFFAEGHVKDVGERRRNLEKLRDAVLKHEADILQALKDDLNKSEFEAYATEVGIVLAEIRHALKHLTKWVKPVRVKTPITHVGSAGYRYPEPYGVALIIAPWNYPFMLAMTPLVGAIAAGNCAVLKPSELSVHTSDVMDKILREIFPKEFVAVIQGGVEISTALLEQPFDYVFFTGSTQVGKIVMHAAAKHLIPVTLELGGKSPCIVHEDAKMNTAVRRIVWGKFINAGQTCVAPDYVLVQKNVKDGFIRAMKEEIHRVYGQDPLSHPDYPRIINDQHYGRLTEYLRQGTILAGGRSDVDRRVIEPTLVAGVLMDDPVMQDEIFGPILPVLEYDSVDEAAQVIQHHPKPLAFYLFTESASVQKQLLADVSFGGGCINDTVYHLATPYLPFGGVGPSGMGGYHGKYSFDTFSHFKSVLKQTTKFDLPFRYGRSKNALQRIKWFLK